MPKFEVTVERPNGDWLYWRGEYKDFQAACESAIDSWMLTGTRLIRVERMADYQVSGPPPVTKG